MPYYPKQGAIIDGDANAIRYCRKSKTVWAKLLKNFILRRKSPSYSVCIRDGYYCGAYKLMCRDKWSVSPISGNLTNEIVLEIQAPQNVLALLTGAAEMAEIPTTLTIASAFPSGKIVTNDSLLERTLSYRGRRNLFHYLQTHYNVEHISGISTWTSKEFAVTTAPRMPIHDAGVSFNRHMAQWEV